MNSHARLANRLFFLAGSTSLGLFTSACASTSSSAAPIAPTSTTSASRIAAAEAAALSLYNGDATRASPDYGRPDPLGKSPRILKCGAILAPPVRPLPLTSGILEKDFEALVRSVQDEICAAIEAVEGGGQHFREDVWTRSEGGGGRSRVLQEGRVFSKAGVNVSTVHGMLPPAAVAQMRARQNQTTTLAAAATTTTTAAAAATTPVTATTVGGPFRFATGATSTAPLPFFACGVSLVLHPREPRAPTAHANYRLFVVQVPGEGVNAPPHAVWWFGGGADLTPSYVMPSDAKHFHGTLKAACDRSPSRTAFSRFKVWADDYFASPHRGGERRGVGGIFFDDIDEATLVEKDLKGAGAGNPYHVLPFVADAARSFIHAYLPIIEARHDENAPPSPREARWQALRRGRYVEFNLVHDRGTKFGLATPGARIESILMSLPLEARWEYMAEPEVGSPEAASLAILQTPVDWV